ncbi:unnamed protein product [Allacma fusca]|uniref:Uncharacterized protein n=1 Tax=Allacma fusca TaxID=39272 RepID=A0A8J2NVT0_9HEXA|nr:unnamed protein product [Allacma fusca]
MARTVYDFHTHGLAVPGEKCVPAEEKLIEGIFTTKQEHNRQKDAKKILLQICGSWLGYYCDTATGRCDCKSAIMTWEKIPVETQGCHILVGEPCGTEDSTTKLLHDCVNGATCSQDICTCTFPGLKNCTSAKEIPRQVNNASLRLLSTQTFMLMTVAVIILEIL